MCRGQCCFARHIVRFESTAQGDGERISAVHQTRPPGRARPVCPAHHRARLAAPRGALHRHQRRLRGRRLRCLHRRRVRERDGRLVYEPVNSCITLIGQLDGAELITVEDLADNGVLHPVQAAMARDHGSQCGFCTPGIVMSSVCALSRMRRGTRPRRRSTTCWRETCAAAPAIGRSSTRRSGGLRRPADDRFSRNAAGAPASAARARRPRRSVCRRRRSFLCRAGERAIVRAALCQAP